MNIYDLIHIIKISDHIKSSLSAHFGAPSISYVVAFARAMSNPTWRFHIDDVPCSLLEISLQSTVKCNTQKFDDERAFFYRFMHYT